MSDRRGGGRGDSRERDRRDYERAGLRDDYRRDKPRRDERRDDERRDDRRDEPRRDERRDDERRDDRRDERRDDRRDRDYRDRDREREPRDREPRRSRSRERRRERSPSPDDRNARRDRASGFSNRLTQPSDSASAAALIPGGHAALAHAASSIGQSAVDPVTQALMMQAMLQQQPQSSKSSRELYVGNLPAGNVVNELSLKDFISTAVMQAGLNIQPGNPVMQARINGCYAFIEFRNVQECTNCLSLRGIVLYNNELTVDRPMAYRGAPDGIVITWPTVMAAKLAENPELEAEAIGLRSAAQAAAAMTGVMPAAPAAPQMLGGMLPGMAALPGAVDPATKPARELHIGNIPEGTQELEMRMHLESVVLAAGLRDDSFGPGPVVTAVRCSLKFAFAEFRSVEETSRMMALDGSLFKGMSLRVQRPRAYVAPFGQAPVAPLQMAQVGGYGGGGFSAEGSFPAIGGLPSVGLPPPPPPPEGFDYPIAPPMQMQQPQQPVAPATCLLELSNMCTAAEVQSQQDVHDVTDDTKEEMDKYGTVLRLEVIRPPPGSAPSTQVFLLVQFDALDSSAKAFESLQGRTFDGRIVGVRYIAEHEFDARAAAEHQ